MHKQFDTIVGKIVTEAKMAGMTQKMLAEAAGISPEALSRLKKNQIKTTLEKLVEAAGMHIEVVPGKGNVVSTRTAQQKMDKTTFRSRHPTLVWSNPNAGDNVYIQRALLKPDFPVILDAAVEFGLIRVELEWHALTAQGGDEVARSRISTERILKNIRHGYEQVKT